MRVVLLLLALAPAIAAADGQSRYELFNDTDEVLNFSTMDPARGTWKPQTIQPGQRRAFIWASGSDRGKIRIGTHGRGYVEYDIYVGKRYAVVWDARKGVWDFRDSGRLAASSRYADGVPPGNDSPRATHAHQRTASTQNAAGYPVASFSLFNRSNERLEFQTYDPAIGRWTNHVTHPHQRTSYSIGGGYAAGKVRVATRNRGYFEYDVHAGGHYTLVWDKQKGMWDFRRSSNGSRAH